MLVCVSRERVKVAGPAGTHAAKENHNGRCAMLTCIDTIVVIARRAEAAHEPLSSGSRLWASFGHEFI
jgi:hypothetical protein